MKSRGLASVVGILALLGVSLAAREAAAQADRIAASLRSVVEREAPKGVRVGVCVRRLDDGREIFVTRPDEPLEMASTTKLFTTSAALARLGADYPFRTAVVADGSVEGGVLQGDLTIVGGGDPAISGRFYSGNPMHVPRLMAEAVRQAGIAEIAGDLVMDDRFFDRVLRPASWPADDRLWWYGAPVSALSFNDNCVEATVRGGRAPGAPVTLSVAPVANMLAFSIQATTCGANDRAAVRFERGAGGAVAVTGRIRAGDARGDSVAVENPPLFFAAALRAELDRAGVCVRGRTRLVAADASWRPAARTVMVWQTPLARCAAVANQRSQNFYAEQILKTLGAVRRKAGTWEGGIAETLDHAQSCGIAAGAVAMSDGSGLSPGNRATPRALVALLDAMNRSPVRQAFFDSLAVNGHRETSLRNRMTHARALGRVHAKTGTIESRGISALAGYLDAPDGSRYAFAVLVNGTGPSHVARSKRLEDLVCCAVLDAPPPKPRAPSAKGTRR